MTPTRDPSELAALYGVQVGYRDAFRRTRRVDAEHVAAVLRALGAPVDEPDGLTQVLRERWGTLVPPVAAAFAPQPPMLDIRVPARAGDERAVVRLEHEDGAITEHVVRLAEVAPHAKADIAGDTFVAKRVPLDGLPLGYHRAHVSVGRARASTTLIVAPAKAAPWDRKMWGVFLPLHALRTGRDWGAGDLTDLRALLDWTASRGGAVVGTLPLLPTFLDDPFEPSPYSPISRLFWGEFWLDPEASPEAASPDVRALLERADLRETRESLRRARSVDHRRVMALKRGVLEACARRAWSTSAGRTQIEAAMRDEPELETYARFRAATETHGTFEGWPSDDLPDVEEDRWRYHTYVQALAREQVAALGGSPATLLFDLPLGVHPKGYDAWRFPGSFATDASGGAPPDSFFTKGQDWEFAPLHPQRIREQGYGYPIACVRHLLRRARVLRIDHVMGLHRMWWIPSGAEPHEGAYVRTNPEEWYAIVTLESHRADALIVGEDLGTVPSEVRRWMGRHGLHRTYVVQEELQDDPARAMNPVRADAVAGLNTHDMPPFTAFWEGIDIEQRRSAGLLDQRAERTERTRRDRKRRALVRYLRNRGFLARGARDAAAVLSACLVALGASRARAVIVNLEDLWGETEPQNMPGRRVGSNWRRKGRFTLEGFAARSRVNEVLAAVDHARTGRRDDG